MSATAANEEQFPESSRLAAGECSPNRADAKEGAEIALLTHFASPYQIEFFDAVERLKPGAIVVYYLHRTHPTRNWMGNAPRHRARFFKDDPTAFSDAQKDFRTAHFAVFNFYAEPPVPALLKIRVASDRPWCFWGERPGYRHPLLGRLLRIWKLRALHASRQPIWGIGGWAVDAYRKEFGPDHAYVNLPYFSDLTRFQSGVALRFSQDINFLYSGSLSSRKGVDVLARAFCRLAQVEPRARLKIMGQGGRENTMKILLSSCQDRIEWLGFKDWNELPVVYASAHFLCVPSRYDGWGLVVPEGLASGLPVIGSDRTGAALDLLKPGFNGWLVSAGDEDSLYDAMRAAAGLREREYHAMREHARESVAKHSLADGARQFLAAVDCALRKADVA